MADGGMGVWGGVARTAEQLRGEVRGGGRLQVGLRLRHRLRLAFGVRQPLRVPRPVGLGGLRRKAPPVCLGGGSSPLSKGLPAARSARNWSASPPQMAQSQASTVGWGVGVGGVGVGGVTWCHDPTPPPRPRGPSPSFSASMSQARLAEREAS